MDKKLYRWEANVYINGILIGLFVLSRPISFLWADFNVDLPLVYYFSLVSCSAIA